MMRLGSICDIKKKKCNTLEKIKYTHMTHGRGVRLLTQYTL